MGTHFHAVLDSEGRTVPDTQGQRKFMTADIADRVAESCHLENCEIVECIVRRIHHKPLEKK